MKEEEINIESLKKGDLVVLERNGSLYDIESVDLKENVIIIAKSGGGFLYKVSKDKFLDDFKKKIIDFEPTLRDEFVTMDCFEEKSYPCKADKRDLWNGWAKPFFSKEITIKILQDFGLEIKEIGEDFITYIREEEEITIKREKDGFPLGNGYWTWSFE